jgi:hypothetical protein
VPARVVEADHVAVAVAVHVHVNVNVNVNDDVHVRDWTARESVATRHGLTRAGQTM